MTAEISKLAGLTENARDIEVFLVQADEQQRQLERQLAEVDALRHEALQLSASIKPWDCESNKLALWTLQDQLVQAEQQLEELIDELVHCCDRMLELDPHCSQAHSRLADLYWRLFCRAEDDNDARRQQQYLSLLRAHDHDGRYADLIEGTATLQLDTEPDGARVKLSRLQETQRRLRPGPWQDLGTTPLGPVDLAVGSYLLDIRLPGHAPALRPIRIRRGMDLQVRVRLFGLRQVGPSFVHVPAGRFTMGGDPAATGSGPPRAVFVDNVAMARYPVTVGEYILFLDDLATQHPGDALRLTPRPSATQGPDRDPRLPVSGISFDAAQAYCRWLSARTGIEHRLPTEAEWEKAARGVDGRRFPWGDSFDPSFCHMRRSQAGPPRLLPVGASADDVSVYGVRDTAGGISEWTQDAFDDEGQLQVVRGGSYGDGAEACRVASRSPVPRAGHPAVGFRLVRPLPPGGGDRVLSTSIPTALSGPPVEPPGLPQLSFDQAMNRILSMARRLAASDQPECLLPQLLCETVQLVHAERGLLLRLHGRRLELSTSCTADGHPLPPSDQRFDMDVPLAALRQGRSILLGGDPWPLMAIPFADHRTCLLLQRRFVRGSFARADLLIARAAADTLALVLRLGGEK